MSNSEIYVSTDIEANGPIPGFNSMLSFTSIAFSPDGKRIGEYTANLHEIDGASPNLKTMQWWQDHKDSYAMTRVGCKSADTVMTEYHNWLSMLPGKPIFVAYPASYDFMFIYWYLMRFVGDSPFGHAALDIRSYAMASLKTSYSDAKKSNFPDDWMCGDELTHIASEEAYRQGFMFLKMLEFNLNKI